MPGPLRRRGHTEHHLLEQKKTVPEGQPAQESADREGGTPKRMKWSSIREPSGPRAIC